MLLCWRQLCWRKMRSEKGFWLPLNVLTVVAVAIRRPANGNRLSRRSMSAAQLLKNWRAVTVPSGLTIEATAIVFSLTLAGTSVGCAAESTPYLC